jgi:hypothetical protein
MQNLKCPDVAMPQNAIVMVEIQTDHNNFNHETITYSTPMIIML